MSSRTSKWNRKPGNKLFDLGFSKTAREAMKALHKAKKERQIAHRKALGL